MSASTTSTSDSVKSDTVYVSKEHGHAAFQVLNEMRTNSEHCDITLKAGNLVLSAHRVVLAALSPYFRELLLPTNNEKAEKEYVMPDSLKPGAVVAMLEFFYSGTLQINLKSIEDLLAAASTMKVSHTLREKRMILLSFSVAITFLYEDFDLKSLRKSHFITSMGMHFLAGDHLYNCTAFDYGLTQIHSKYYRISHV
ncbi:predicted protein [Nematostella vectensis]|uniref:BTB domain-containing protein n=1 Tax=Nematostella vectensis TaxID=45351 RepID=A7T1G5_NEMVE|nr:predicted protein [Nematostella vectensis]|eukprot:XP_001622304.1 hypothetical protein NEMVEDRAFT_v1g220912 [Nematostella vectensis]